jgi:hypothetical protein
MAVRRAHLFLTGTALLLVLAPTFAGARRMQPLPSLGVHEWGVWLLDGDRVTVDDLARESPPFVHRASTDVPVPDATPTPTPTPPVVRPSPPTARKPVLYFHAGPELRTTDEVPVAVRVGFRNGRPWLHFPGGGLIDHEGQRGLMFAGRVRRARLRSGAPAPRGHFWNHLRAASESTFTANDTGEQEGFLFYDGPSEVTPSVNAMRSGDAVTLTAATADQSAFVVAAGRYAVLRPAPTSTQSLSALARTGRRASGLAAELTRELVSRGLTQKEATALVRTWTHELSGEARPHVISVLPRAAYDAALPMTISPPPRELVRVGVIIERL